MPSIDPTHTATLRRRYSQAMNRRFLALARDLRKSIIDQNALGLVTNEIAPRHAFDYMSDAQKVEAFMTWLRTQVDDGILEVIRRDGNEIVSHYPWQDVFVKAAYIRGMNDTMQTLKRLQVIPAGADIGIGLGLGQPIHADTLALMYTRNFALLRGITDAMSQQIAQELTMGLIEGQGAKQMARRLTKVVDDMSMKRALVLARTETIRTYAEATLNTLESHGVRDVKADVEFLSSNDSRTCPTCLGLEGRIFTTQEARGVIPVHPRCLAADAKVTYSPRIYGVHERPYEGEMLTFYTKGKRTVRCTPNHPILTWSGWTVANRVRPGWKIACLIPRQSDFRTQRIEDLASEFRLRDNVLTDHHHVHKADFYGDGCENTIYSHTYEEDAWMHQNLQDIDCGFLMRTFKDDFTYDWITKIEIELYNGPVYDLTTENGYFVSGEVVVHNCRCTWIAANIGESQEDIERRAERRRKALERREELLSKKKAA